MANAKQVSSEMLEQLRQDREKIARELPELIERGRDMNEAANEGSLSGHLRRAIHGSGRPLKRIAFEAGLDPFVLCDFLEGTRTLRSDVLDRLAQAVGVSIRMEPIPTSNSTEESRGAEQA